MNARKKADEMIDDAYEHVYAGSHNQTYQAISIALWCANIAYEASRNEKYWENVIKYINEELDAETLS